MEIRPYAASDREACLGVWDSVEAGAGREEFEAFLDGAGERFFVAEHDGAVIGCGGFALQGGAARLEWGMVRREWQRQGLGRFLLFYRMREIGKAGEAEMVTAECPAAVAEFYAKQGFRESGAAGGRVTMVKRLAVCA